MSRVMEMAEEFPRVLFRGFDIGDNQVPYLRSLGVTDYFSVVPIATRYPTPNVQFEVDDVNSQLRGRERTFDLVNARTIAMTVSIK